MGQWEGLAVESLIIPLAHKVYRGPRQANLVLIAYASSEGSGEPAHPRSLARTSAARSYKQWVRGTFRQKARSLAPLNGWACAVKICHDGMLEDTNSLDGAHIVFVFSVTMLVDVCVNFFLRQRFLKKTTEPRILKFGANVGYNLLYCVRENQPPPAYHSLYLSIFLSL